jgi:hypothetical protein
LANDFLARQNDLYEWRLSFIDRDSFLDHRLIPERGAGQIVATGDKSREFKAALFSSCSVQPSFAQAWTGECA